MPNSIDRNAQDRNFYPMLVSLRKSTDDSKQDALQKWSDFNMLPDKYKDLLISEEMSGTIKNIYIEFHQGSFVWKINRRRSDYLYNE